MMDAEFGQEIEETRDEISGESSGPDMTSFVLEKAGGYYENVCKATSYHDKGVAIKRVIEDLMRSDTEDSGASLYVNIPHLGEPVEVMMDGTKMNVLENLASESFCMRDFHIDRAYTFLGNADLNVMKKHDYNS